MQSSAPMNIPAKSWIKDSSTSNSSSLSSPQGMSSLGSSPVHSSLDFNPPCPNCSSTSCTAAFNPSFSPCSSFSRMTELTASTRRKRTSSWSNVWNSMSRNKWPHNKFSRTAVDICYFSINIQDIHYKYNFLKMFFVEKINWEILKFAFPYWSVLSHKYWVYIVNAAAPTEGQDDKQPHPGKTFPAKEGREGSYPYWEGCYPVSTTHMQKLTFEGDGAISWDSPAPTIFHS